MANLQYSADLRVDVLFRAGEPGDGSSDWQAQALSYMNRAYRAICQGGAEFDPSINEGWWWLRSPEPGVLILKPSATAVTTFTHGSASITFSVAPTVNYTGWWITVEGHDAAFRVATHGVGLVAAMLDAPWTGATGAVTATLTSLEYDLPTTLLRVLAPMHSASGHEINLVDWDGGGVRWRWPPFGERRVPDVFSPIGDRRVRFNAVPNALTRVEFEWLVRPADLTGAALEEPVLPRAYRHLIADGALYFVNVDKNDNRADTAGLLLKAGLKAMQREHRNRMITQNRLFGHLTPRMTQPWWSWETTTLP